MTPEARAKLRELAEKATPGPWSVDYDRSDKNPEPDEVYGIRDGKNKAIVVTDAGFYPPKKPEAEYIAAAHPQAILELLDALDEAERRLKHYEEWG